MEGKDLAWVGTLTLFFLSLVLLPAHSYGTIYKWVDKKGQIHISDYYPGDENIADEPAKPAPDTVARETEATAPVPETEEPVQVQLPQKAQPEPQRAQPTSTAENSDPRIPALPDFPKFPEGKLPGMPPGALIGLISFITSFFLIIVVVFYLFFSACLYAIAKKLCLPSPFLAWIPIVQVWTFVVAAKGTEESPVLWIIGLIVPLISIVVITYLWMCISENMGKSPWLGLLTLLPVANLVFMAWLAFQKGPSSASEEGLPVGAG